MDIRTVFMLATAYNFLFAITMLVYSRSVKGKRGTVCMGAAFLTLSISFGLTALRGFVGEFWSVLFSNVLLTVASMIILYGLRRFYGDKTFAWVFHLGVLIVFIIAYVHYTFQVPDTRARILLVTASQILYFSLIMRLLIQKAIGVLKYPNYMVSLMLGFIILWSVFRLVWSFFEGDIVNFMDAGWVHGIAVALYHVYPMGLIIGVIWMANAQYVNDIETYAQVDPLTGLYNRRALLLQGERELQRAVRKETGLAVLMVDIDGFKEVNDRWGHECGDRVLSEVAKAMEAHLRKPDLVSRYGGEELVLLIQEVDPPALMRVMDKLRRVVHEVEIQTEDAAVRVTVSLGACLMGKPYETLQEAIQHADEAMYHAKRLGKNRGVLYAENGMQVLSGPESDAASMVPVVHPHADMP